MADCRVEKTPDTMVGRYEFDGDEDRIDQKL
jgi:hypothetical protein